jgi:putative sterol carrier protein
MADQPVVPQDVTPDQFFEQFMPLGFQQQVAEGTTPGNITIQYTLTGDGGGSWLIEIADGKMNARKGTGEASIAYTVSTAQWREAMAGQHGSSPALIVPPQRPGRPDQSGRAKTLKGTMALELARDGADPFKVETTFGGAAAPRTVMKLRQQDYLDMQTGKLNGQEAFMTGKMKIEGDMGFLMQIAALVG